MNHFAWIHNVWIRYETRIFCFVSMLRRRSRGYIVSADGLALIWCNGKADGRAKNVEINEKAPRSAWKLPVRDARQPWMACEPSWKVEHSNDHSDGSPVNASDLQLDLLQLVPILPRSVDYFRCEKVTYRYVYIPPLYYRFSLLRSLLPYV